MKNLTLIIINSYILLSEAQISSYFAIGPNEIRSKDYSMNSQKLSRKKRWTHLFLFRHYCLVVSHLD